MKDSKAKEPEEDDIINVEATAEMDDLERTACQILTCWNEKSRSLFPEYQHPRIRKSNVFKSLAWRTCYKLARETKGVLTAEEYPLYVRAQLEILKAISKSQTSHPIIDVNCLVGPKAWVRWKLWKKKYDVKKRICEATVSMVPKGKVCQSLESTKEFLIKHFGKLPSYDEFLLAVENKNLHRWITLGKVSPYYLVLSPFVARAFPEGIENLRLDSYREGLDPSESAMCFADCFPNELTAATR